MIVPIIFLVFVVYFPYPESLDITSRLIITIVPFLIIKFYLTKFLNRKFPTYRDARDDLKNLYK